ncbi:hypothetical protein R80B4_01406 [Fibrobacteres bacterium R8-0-B4]
MSIFSQKLKALLMMTAAVLTVGAGAGSAQTKADYSGTYYIVTKNGTSLHTNGAAVADGTNIVLWNEYNSGTTQAQWSFALQSDGAYTIKNVKSGKVIDVPRSSKDNGTELTIYAGGGTANQKWNVTPNVDGYVSIKNVNSGLAMDVPKNSAANGTKIIQYEYHGGNSQQFKLVPVETAEEKAAKAEAEKGTFTDTRDKKTYKTVKIGELTWMAENLNFATNGKCYDNKNDNCAKYGRLYDWNTAKTSCPAGWHLPKKEEWEALLYVAAGGGSGNQFTAAKALKSTSEWYSDEVGTDDYGFSAMPGGAWYAGEKICRSVGGTTERYCGPVNFDGIGERGYWWTASASEKGYAYCAELKNGVYIDDYEKKTKYAFSVRCVK